MKRKLVNILHLLKWCVTLLWVMGVLLMTLEFKSFLKIVELQRRIDELERRVSP